jgi:hypothetical protein
MRPGWLLSGLRDLLLRPQTLAFATVRIGGCLDDIAAGIDIARPGRRELNLFGCAPTNTCV